MNQVLQTTCLAVALGFLAFQTDLTAQDFWQPTNGPYGGSIRTLALGEGGLRFAGTDGGLYRSSDAGATWQQIATVPRELVSDILVLSNNQVLVGTIRQGIWRSNNNGQSFKQVLHGVDVRAIAGDPSGRLYAGAYRDGLYLSTDNGGNWAPLALHGESVLALFITSSGVLLAGATEGIFRSDDGGETWGFAELQNSDVRSFAENAAGNLFAAAWRGGIFRSTDGGESWAQVDSGLTVRSIEVIVINSRDELLVGTSDGVFISRNNGETWVAHSLQGYYVHALLLESQQRLLAGTLTHGLFRSNDGGASWVEGHTGILNTRIFGLTATPGGDIFAGTGSGGIYRSQDNGNSWSKVYEADASPSPLISTSRGEILAIAWRHLLRSRDNGNSWEQLIHPFGEEPISTMKYTRFDEIYLGGTRGRLYRSLDGGVLWTLLFDRDDYDHEIVGVDVNGEGDIFFATQDAGLYRSTDNGKSWQRLNPPFANRQLFDLVSDRLGQIYVGTNGDGVFLSVDNGDTWIEGGLKNVTGRKLLLDAYGNIFVATLRGAFKSRNNGRTWTEIYSGMGKLSILDLELTPSGYLFAGTDGNGIFRSSLLAGTKPESFVFVENYPNPFNATTTIEFQLQETSRVRLAIHNVLGQRVATLLNQSLSPGVYKIRWDARGLPSGLYLCHITTGEVSETIRLLLMR